MRLNEIDFCVFLIPILQFQKVLNFIQFKSHSLSKKTMTLLLLTPQYLYYLNHTIPSSHFDSNTSVSVKIENFFNILKTPTRSEDGKFGPVDETQTIIKINDIQLFSETIGYVRYLFEWNWQESRRTSEQMRTIFSPIAFDLLTCVESLKFRLLDSKVNSYLEVLHKFHKYLEKTYGSILSKDVKALLFVINKNTLKNFCNGDNRLSIYETQSVNRSNLPDFRSFAFSSDYNNRGSDLLREKVRNIESLTLFSDYTSNDTFRTLSRHFRKSQGEFPKKLNIQNPYTNGVIHNFFTTKHKYAATWEDLQSLVVYRIDTDTSILNFLNSGRLLRLKKLVIKRSFSYSQLKWLFSFPNLTSIGVPMLNSSDDYVAFTQQRTSLNPPPVKTLHLFFSNFSSNVNFFRDVLSFPQFYQNLKTLYLDIHTSNNFHQACTILQEKTGIHKIETLKVRFYILINQSILNEFSKFVAKLTNLKQIKVVHSNANSFMSVVVALTKISTLERIKFHNYHGSSTTSANGINSFYHLNHSLYFLLSRHDVFPNLKSFIFIGLRDAQLTSFMVALQNTRPEVVVETFNRPTDNSICTNINNYSYSLFVKNQSILCNQFSKFQDTMNAPKPPSPPLSIDYNEFITDLF